MADYLAAMKAESEVVGAVLRLLSAQHNADNRPEDRLGADSVDYARDALTEAISDAARALGV